MRVLAGITGEELNIGPQITITVLEVSGKTVRLAIEAPHHLDIRKAHPETVQAPAAACEATGEPSQESPFFAEFA